MGPRHDDGRQFLIPLDAVESTYQAPARNSPTGFVTPRAEDVVVFGKPLHGLLKERGHGWVVNAYAVLKTLDWSPFVAAYSGKAGRSPYHPRLMTGLILYGVIKGASSTREIESLAAIDLGATFMAAGLVPDHSTVDRFLRRHGALLTEQFFISASEAMFKHLGSKGQSAALDGTVVEAAASRFKLMMGEAVQQQAQQAEAAAKATPDDKEVQAAAERAKHLAEHASARQQARKENHDKGDIKLATTEPEAVVQRRKDGVYRPAYKPSVIVNKDRFIVGQHVHPSNETASVVPLLEQHNDVVGRPPDELSMDAGYHNAEVLEEVARRELNALIPSGREDHPGMEREANKKLPKTAFRYEAEADRYRCPENRLLVLTGVVEGKEPYRRYTSESCDGCPRRAQCTTSTEGRRTIRRFPHDEVAEVMRTVMKHPQARAAFSQRKAMVEPVFSVLRGRQGLNRFRRRGLKNVALEFAVHCIAYNLRLTSERVRAVVRRLLRLLVLRHPWARDASTATVWPDTDGFALGSPG